MGAEGSAVGREIVRVIPYGSLAKTVRFVGGPGMRLTRHWLRPRTKEVSGWQLLVASVHAMDEKFQDAFRLRSTSSTRLLVINDSNASDLLISRLLKLNIRSPERFYVAEDARSGGDLTVLVASLLRRMSAAVEAQESHCRILDARIEEGILRVVSPSFQRMEIPVTSIPKLRVAGPKEAGQFEIDADGSYLFWPALDLHLGWEQLRQIVEPEAFFKAQRKSHEFNVRYGSAIKKVREAAGIVPRSIAGLSDKQVRRIESGQCRSTNQALQKLADAHHLEINAYLRRIAGAMT